MSTRVAQPKDILHGSMAQNNWTTREQRRTKARTDAANRNEKRSRIGNRVDRAITKSAKGHLHPKWSLLCAKAHSLNK